MSKRQLRRRGMVVEEGDGVRVVVDFQAVEEVGVEVEIGGRPGQKGVAIRHDVDRVIAVLPDLA